MTNYDRHKRTSKTHMEVVQLKSFDPGCEASFSRSKQYKAHLMTKQPQPLCAKGKRQTNFSDGPRQTPRQSSDERTIVDTSDEEDDWPTFSYIKPRLRHRKSRMASEMDMAGDRRHDATSAKDAARASGEKPAPSDVHSFDSHNIPYANATMARYGGIESFGRDNRQGEKARLDMTNGDKIQIIDELINSANPENQDEIKELKQHKRRLRNRQMAYVVDIASWRIVTC